LNQQKIGAWFETWRDQVLRKSLGVAAQLRRELTGRDSDVKRLTAEHEKIAAELTEKTSTSSN